MADIIVTTLAGRRYHVPRSFSGSVEDLKCLLETAWSIPTREQRLFHNFEELAPRSAIRLGVRMCIMMVRRNPEQAYWLDRAQRGYFWDSEDLAKQAVNSPQTGIEIVSLDSVIQKSLQKATI